MKRLKDLPAYGVTTAGQVFSYKRGKFLKAADNGLGYKFVNIGGKKRYVHRLVAETFLDQPDGLAEVNHKDGKKAHNHVSNLEWIQHNNNLHHYFDSSDAQTRFNKYIDDGVDVDAALYSLC